MTRAIKAMQRFGGLKETGVLGLSMFYLHNKTLIHIVLGIWCISDWIVVSCSSGLVQLANFQLQSTGPEKHHTICILHMCLGLYLWMHVCFPADPATLGLMKTPRCSLPDVSEPDMSAGRQKRALAPQNKWNKRHLSWRYIHFWDWDCLSDSCQAAMNLIHLNSIHTWIKAAVVVRADGKRQN